MAIKPKTKLKPDWCAVEHYPNNSLANHLNFGFYLFEKENSIELFSKMLKYRKIYRPKVYLFLFLLYFVNSFIHKYLCYIICLYFFYSSDYSSIFLL